MPVTGCGASTRRPRPSSRAASTDRRVGSSCSPIEQGKPAELPAAAAPEVAEPLIDAFVGALRSDGIRVEGGVFGAMMEVELVNDGPVTIVLEL